MESTSFPTSLALEDGYTVFFSSCNRIHPPFSSSSLLCLSDLNLTCLSHPQRKAAEKSAEKTSGGRAKKDPNAPKRALSAYMFFSQDWRERIKNENPDAGFGTFFFSLGLPVYCPESSRFVLQVKSASY